MTYRLIEGFDAGTDITRYLGKRTSISGCSLATSGGRFNSGCLSLTASNATCFRTFDAQPTWICGFAWQFSGGTSNTDVIRIEDGTTTQVSLYKDSGGALRIYRGTGTLLATSAAALAPNTWYFIEIAALIADSGGYVLVRVDGADFVSVTNADTKQSSTNAWASVIKFMQNSSSNTNKLDDVYVLDGTGTPNDFLGDHRVRTLLPAVDDAVQFSRSGGSYNYANVAESSADDDASYNESSTAGAKDLFRLNGLPANPGAVRCLQVSVRARKDDAGARSIRTRVKSGATEANGASNALNTTYQYFADIYPTDPATGAAWTDTAVNNSSMGYEAQ